jgi:hypothetical protein
MPHLLLIPASGSNVTEQLFEMCNYRAFYIAISPCLKIECAIAKTTNSATMPSYHRVAVRHCGARRAMR